MWKFKQGFVSVTRDDLEVAFVSIAEGKQRCERMPRCAAITFRSGPAAGQALWIYLKAEATVTEGDGAWASYVKQPAGLLDVHFDNELGRQLDVCWVDVGGRAAPSCYGAVRPWSSKSLSSFVGHYFVMKRLLWRSEFRRVCVPTATGVQPAGAVLHSDSWGGRAAVVAHSVSGAPFTVHNSHEQAVELCTGARWSTRLQHADVPPDIEVCHGVAPSSGSLTLRALRPGSVLVARALAGVVRIENGSRRYSSGRPPRPILPHPAANCLPTRPGPVTRPRSAVCTAAARWRANGRRLPPAGVGAPWALLSREVW